MKTWEVPQIFDLELEMTKDNTNNAFTHHCHKTDGDSNNCLGGPSDHSSSGNKIHIFTGGICQEHGKNDAVACCCYTDPINPNPPGQS